MADDITIAGTKDGQPIYRWPHATRELTFMEKYLGGATFTALSMTGVAKVASVLALSFAGEAEGAAEELSNMADGVEDKLTGELVTKPSFAAAREAGAGFFASVGAAVKGLGFGGTAAVIGAAGVAGAVVNKHQVEKRVAESVEIKPASRLNAGIFHGAMTGFILSAGVLGAGVSFLGAPALVVAALGAAGTAYGAWSKSEKVYKAAGERYESTRKLYEAQEQGRINNPADVRLDKAKEELGVAGAIGVAGSAAAVNGEDVISGVTNSVIGMDEAPDASGHPAHGKPEGYHAAKIMAERGHNSGQIQGKEVQGRHTKGVIGDRERKVFGDVAKDMASVTLGIS